MASNIVDQNGTAYGLHFLGMWPGKHVHVYQVVLCSCIMCILFFLVRLLVYAGETPSLIKMLLLAFFRLHECNANENAKANTKLVATAAKSSLKTWTFALFSNRHLDYSNSLTYSNVGELSWFWIPKNGSVISKFRKRKEMLSLLVYVLHKTLN